LERIGEKLTHATNFIKFTKQQFCAYCMRYGQPCMPKLHASFSRSTQYYCLLGRTGYTLGFATHF